MRFRTLTELAPQDRLPAGAIEAAREAVVASRLATAITKKQKDTGVWGGNLLGLAPSVSAGIKEVGTIPQYRRLLQLGLPAGNRAFKLADRVLFRLLSNDPDPALLFEFAKLVTSGKDEDDVARTWVRDMTREAATCALAEAGHIEDPRVRGSAHKIANSISQFLRSELAEQPFIKSAGQLVLNPLAHPPTWYSVAMIAAMPNLRRERAGFADRLGHYLAQPAPKKPFVVQVGKKTAKPMHLLLGDPIEADAKGTPKDLPLALHYIELLARMGALQWAPVATKVLARLLKDCDDTGVWRPKGLRSPPKPADRISYHEYPLMGESKEAEARHVDVTFRLAVIARLLGWTLEHVEQ